MIKTQHTLETRISQGDIFEEVEFIENAVIQDDELIVTKTVFPFAIVLTQDCDLEQDNNVRQKDEETRDQQLISVLVAPIYNEEHFFAGEHLKELTIISMRQNSERKGKIKSNQNQRYHYLEFSTDVPIPNSVIDFKHYFSIPVQRLHDPRPGKSNRICRVAELYREDISQRFASYLSRIGLPSL